MAVDQDAIRANMRHLVTHEAKPQPKPLADDAVTRGFEKVAFPKIVRELQDDNLIIRQKALLAARDLLAFPINNVQCIAAGMTPALVSLLRDQDELCRERAAGTIECLVVKDVGARDLIQHDGTHTLVKCLCDVSAAVKEASYKALVEACRFDSARRAIIDQRNALPLLLGLVQVEPPHLQRLGLTLLNACTHARHNAEAIRQLAEPGTAAADQRAVPVLTSLLAPSHAPDIQQLAAEVLGVVTSNHDAKLEAVRVGAVPRLLALLQPSRIALATSAGSALMAISVVKEAKEAVIATQGGLEALVALLDPSNQQLCVNALECITNVAEAPQARPMLAQLGAAEIMNKIHADPPTEEIKRAAAEALRQCRFKCWPFETLPGRTIPPHLLEQQQQQQPPTDGAAQ